MGLHSVYFVLLLFSLVSLYRVTTSSMLCPEGSYCQAGENCTNDNSSCIEGTCSAEEAKANDKCDPDLPEEPSKPQLCACHLAVYSIAELVRQNFKKSATCRV